MAIRYTDYQHQKVGPPCQSIALYNLPDDYKAYSKNKPIKLSDFDELKNWWNNREGNEQAWQVNIETIKANGYDLDIKNPHQVEEEIQHTSAELLELLHQSFARSDELLSQLKKEIN